MVALHHQLGAELEVGGGGGAAVGVGARGEGDDLVALGVVGVDLRERVGCGRRSVCFVEG